MAGNQYVSSVKYASVPIWTASTTLAVGALRRQTAPTDINSRVFRVNVITTGTTGATEPVWQTSAGASTTDSGVTWVEVTGSSWAAPHKNIQNSVASGWGSTNNCFIYVDSTHNYSSAGTIDWSGANLGNGAGRKIISVNAAGSTPPAAVDYLVGAKETTNGNNSFTNRPNVGSYIRGVSVVIGVGGAGTALCSLDASQTAFLDWGDASITLSSTGASSAVNFGTTSTSAQNEVHFTNMTFKFGAVGQKLAPQGGRWFWTGGSVDGSGVIPTALISCAATPVSYGVIEGVNLSACTGTLVSHGSTTSTYTQFSDCSLNASATMASWGNALLGPVQGWVDSINCDSGASTYHRRRYMVQGALTTDIVNVLDGGASDGTTPFSWKVVTNNTPQNYDAYVNPFVLPPIDIYNEAPKTTSITLNVLSSLTLKDNDIGFDVYYLGNIGTVRAAIASTIPNILSIGTNLPTGSFGWNTAGVPTPVQQQISITVIPVMAGLFRLQPKVLRANLTVWIDPVPVGMIVSAARITVDSNIRTVLL